MTSVQLAHSVHDRDPGQPQEQQDEAVGDAARGGRRRRAHEKVPDGTEQKTTRCARVSLLAFLLVFSNQDAMLGT